MQTPGRTGLHNAAANMYIYIYIMGVNLNDSHPETTHKHLFYAKYTPKNSNLENVSLAYTYGVKLWISIRQIGGFQADPSSSRFPQSRQSLPQCRRHCIWHVAMFHLFRRSVGKLNEGLMN